MAGVFGIGRGKSDASASLAADEKTVSPSQAAEGADPGQVTGLVSLLPVFYQKELSLQPEFSEACLEGEFFLKGRIRAASLLLLALKIWFNKDFQKVYKHLKAM